LCAQVELRPRTALATVGLKDQFTVLDLDHGNRQRMAAAVEEHAGQLSAVLLDLEPVDVIRVLASAGEIPPAQVRVLLLCAERRDGREDDRAAGDDELPVDHGCILCEICAERGVETRHCRR
jgi:hypothetical protein